MTELEIKNVRITFSQPRHSWNLVKKIEIFSGDGTTTTFSITRTQLRLKQWETVPDNKQVSELIAVEGSDADKFLKFLETMTDGTYSLGRHQPIFQFND